MHEHSSTSMNLIAKEHPLKTWNNGLILNYGLRIRKAFSAKCGGNHQELLE